MSPSALVELLIGRGVTLSADGDQLRVKAPRGALTPDDRAGLARHKAAVLALLAGPGLTDVNPSIEITTEDRARLRTRSAEIQAEFRRITGGLPLTDAEVAEADQMAAEEVGAAGDKKRGASPLTEAPDAMNPEAPPPPALIAPHARTVVVAVWAEEDPSALGGWATDVQFLPVLAISARATDDGGVEYDPLIVHPDPAWGVCPASHLDGYELAYRLAAAPWPPEQDPERLAGVVGDLENRAIREAAERRERSAAREMYEESKGRL